MGMPGGMDDAQITKMFESLDMGKNRDVNIQVLPKTCCKFMNFEIHTLENTEVSTTMQDFTMFFRDIWDSFINFDTQSMT
jgi:hypothetical protein